MADYKVRMFESEDDLSVSLADYIAELSEASIKERGAFYIVLSGWPLIRLLGKLTKAPYLKTVEWSKWYVFWAEEKVIPGRKLESNYMQAKEEFLSKVPIRPGHINPVSQTGSAASSAEEYEYTIRRLVQNRTLAACMTSDCPMFDLVLLVLERDDGSSMIMSNSVQETDWVCPVSSTGQDQLDWVTLSLPVINSAVNSAVIVTEKAVRPMLAADRAGLSRGAAHGLTRDVVWFVDMAAASD